jgi:O-antigen ligase
MTEKMAFWLLIAVLAWVPFPLGSNRPWSWSLLVLAVALCWVFWSLSVWIQPDALRFLRRLKVPLMLAGLVLIWGFIQALSWVPLSWTHPAWQLAAEELDRPLTGSISISPWRTLTEVMKLGTYVVAAALAFMLSQRREQAQRLLSALMVIGLFYALYALLMGIAEVSQLSIFYPAYSTGPSDGRFGAPFVSQNNFATYIGLSMLCASARLYDSAGRTLVIGRGMREFTMSAIYFVFGVGALPFAVFCMSFAMLVASGSRAGFISGLAGMAVLLILVGINAGRGFSRRWVALAVTAIVIAMASLFMITGENLQGRLNALVETRAIDETRLLLWDAAIRMIADAPFLGLGLGTYEPAYPLYADRILPFIMDKAHNDFLEFAAGIGLPAAMAWWAAILWLIAICVRGFNIRRRNRHYSLLALAVTALVGVHSLFDFSLQIPAIALTYAVILGMGVAQSAPSRERESVHF